MVFDLRKYATFILASLFLAPGVLAAPSVDIIGFGPQNGGTIINSTAKNIEPNQEVRVAYQVSNFPNGQGFVLGNEIVRKNGKFGFFVPNFNLGYDYFLTPKVFGYGDGRSAYCFDEYRDITRDNKGLPFASIEDVKLNTDGTFKIVGALGLSKELGMTGESLKLNYCFDVYIVDKNGNKIFPNNGTYSNSVNIVKGVRVAGSNDVYKKIEFVPKGVYINDGEEACVKLFARQEGSEIFSTPYYCFPGQPYVATEKPTEATARSVKLNGAIRSFPSNKPLYAGFAIISDTDYNSYVNESIDTGEFFNGLPVPRYANHGPWVDWTQLPKADFVWLNQTLKPGKNVKFSSIVDYRIVPDDGSGSFYYAACAGTQKDPQKVVCGNVFQAFSASEQIQVKTLPPKPVLVDMNGTQVPNSEFMLQGKVVEPGFYRTLYTFFNFVKAGFSGGSSADLYSNTPLRQYSAAGKEFNFEPASPVAYIDKPGQEKICYIACASTQPTTDIFSGAQCDWNNVQCLENPEYIRPDVINSLSQVFLYSGKGFSISGVVSNWKKYLDLEVGVKYYKKGDAQTAEILYDQKFKRVTSNSKDGTIDVFVDYNKLVSSLRDSELNATLCVRQYNTQEPFCAPNPVNIDFNLIPDVVAQDEKKIIERGKLDPFFILYGRINNINNFPGVFGGFKIIPDGADESKANYIWTPTILSGGDSSYLDYSVNSKFSAFENKSSNSRYYYSACAKDQMMRVFCEEKKYLLEAGDSNCTPKISILAESTKIYSNFQNQLEAVLFARMSGDICRTYTAQFTIWPVEDASKQQIFEAGPLNGKDFAKIVNFDKEMASKSPSQRYNFIGCLKGNDGTVFCSDIYLLDGSKVNTALCSAPLESSFSSKASKPVSFDSTSKTYQFAGEAVTGPIILGFDFSAKSKIIPGGSGVVEGLDDCRHTSIEIHENSCLGNKLSGCQMIGNSVECSTNLFSLAKENGEKHLYWCFDRNIDGKFDGVDESGLLATIRIEKVNEAADLDWRNKDGKNWVTPVGDQGRLGACIAFSTCAAMESCYLIEGNNPNRIIDLSEMWLHAQIFQYINDGGVALAQAYRAAVGGQGLPDENIFPYSDEKIPDTSQYRSRGTSAAKIAQANAVQTHFLIAMLKRGPVRVGLHINEGKPQDSTRFENNTLICNGNDSINHAVALVGYKITKGNEASPQEGYWIAKNSWGISSGDNGYFKIKFDDCGVNKEVIELSGITRPNK